MFNTGNAEDAIPLIEKAAGRSPVRANIHVNLGNAYSAANRHADAANAYRRATDIVPNDVNALHRLATACSQLAQYDDAATVLKKAIVVNPGNGALHMAFGVAFKNAGILEEAELFYPDILEKIPNYAEASANLAVVLQKQGRIDEALKGYRDAVSLKPEYFRRATINKAATGKGNIWLNLDQAKASLLPTPKK